MDRNAFVSGGRHTSPRSGPLRSKDPESPCGDVRLANGGGSGGLGLKNGEGGIRGIELFVQALQLIHAGTRSGRCATGSSANAARAATGSRAISRSAWVTS
jgi:hypothetical protein